MPRAPLSLRRQVGLLGAAVLAVVALAVGVLAASLRSTESAVVGAERRRVMAAAHALAAAFPAQWAGAAVERATDGRVRVVAASGSPWQGRGEVLLRANGGEVALGGPVGELEDEAVRRLLTV